MKSKIVPVYTEWRPLISTMSDADAGAIFKSMLAYQDGEDANQCHPVWLYLKSKIDDFNLKGVDISEKNKLNARKRWDAVACGGTNRNANDAIITITRQDNNKIVNNIKVIRPSLSDVQSYCKERNNSVDAEKWFDYYSSNGWKIGKNAMKDWKAAVRTWEKSQFSKSDVKFNPADPNDELMTLEEYNAKLKEIGGLK